VDSVTTDRKEALSQWGDWLSTHWDWDLFVTLTHDNSEAALGRGTRTIVGWSASSDRWDQWLDESVIPRIRRSAGGLPGSPYWVRGREPNPWRKGTHFHALIGGVGDIDRRAIWRDWFAQPEDGGLGFGLARILPYEPSRGAAHYLTKYVVKDLGDIVFSGNLKANERVQIA